MTHVIISLLILQLGSPSYRDREKASHTLSRIPPAVPYLQAAQHHKCPEIACRASHLLTGFYRQNAERFAAEAMPTNYPRMPWIDMTSPDMPDRYEIQSKYLSMASKDFRGVSQSPVWDEYRLATRLYVRDLFRQGYSPEAVRAILDKMAECERNWIEVNGKNYSPPLEVPK